MEKRTFEKDFKGRKIIVEIGKMAKQAAASCLVRYGDTVVLTAVTNGKEPVNGDFFPLTVLYQEKQYSVGKIPGGFIKREGKPTENATLAARLIDRPIRPLFKEGFQNEVQVINTVLSVDTDASPELTALFGSSLALSISDLPFEGPIAGVVVGRVAGQFIINPNKDEQEQSDIYLTVAGTKDAINMVESSAKEVSEDDMLEALMFGHEAVKKLVEFENTIVKEIGQEKMEYEKAAEYRDLLSSVKKVAQKQKITSSSMEDRDIIAMAMNDTDAVVQVFFVREGKLIGRDHFGIRIGAEKDSSQILTSFVKQFYAGTPFLPKELWIQREIEDMEVIEQWLSARKGQKVRIVVPKKGQKERLVELAQKNASMVLRQDLERNQRDEMRTIGAMNEVASWLGLTGVRRMEAFDISNISGYESVGSMVVYEDGRPKRSDYRKFRIRTVTGPNDYASMREVLMRRFTHGLEEMSQLKEQGEEQKFGSFTRFPDILMMDGGRGQVNIAQEVLAELGLSIPVCGMVKDDSHRTRGLYYRNVEIPIDRHSEGFRLITRIQDEAHRFAIEYHRSLRSKNQVHSVLDDIPGIGDTRRKALMKHFRSIEAVQAASEEELSQVPGMNRAAAESVYRFFRSSETCQRG